MGYNINFNIVVILQYLDQKEPARYIVTNIVGYMCNITSHNYHVCLGILLVNFKNSVSGLIKL